MSMNFRSLCLVTALGLSLAMGDAAAQDNSNKYQQWPGAEGGSGSEDVSKLVQDIQKLIDQAEKDKAADPQFLDDLRGVLADYQNPWTTRLLYDDFSDATTRQHPPGPSAAAFSRSKKRASTSG